MSGNQDISMGTQYTVSTTTYTYIETARPIFIPVQKPSTREYDL